MLHIKEPFYTAGRKYFWPKEFGTIGVGIDIKLLNGDGNLELKIGGSSDEWFISKNTVSEFSKEYNSYHMAKTVRLAVIPWKLLTKKIPNQEQLI